MKTTSVPVVVLKLPRTANGVLSFARSVLLAMKDNAAFPEPTVPLDRFEADIDALTLSQAYSLTRAKGAREERDARLLVVRCDLDHLRCYVEGVAFRSGAQALAVVESAGMSSKRVGSRTKGELDARPGPVSGSAHLIARAVARQASYEWQWSLDGVTWTDAPPTLQAETTLYGFTRGTCMFFRFRPLYRGGLGDCSQVVSLLVE